MGPRRPAARRSRARAAGSRGRYGATLTRGAPAIRPPIQVAGTAGPNPLLAQETADAPRRLGAHAHPRE
eukprot:9251466-Lingulodinium_polyedra.AAC.1